MKKQKCRKNVGRNRSLGLMKNYFVAVLVVAVVVAWIANLGVVPLFLISAFLLAPAFFFFLNLLFSVTHVLETIGILLYNNCDHHGINSNKYNWYGFLKSKPYFLPTNTLCVKGIFIICPLILSLLAPNTALSQSIQESSDLILSRGQSITLKLEKMEKFNIGNKEVIKYRFDEASKTLTIRGQTIGTSELLVWEKGQRSPRKQQIFVISKAQEAKHLHLAQLLSKLGLDVRPHLPHLQVSGEIKSAQLLSEYKTIQKTNPHLLIDETTLSEATHKEVLAEIYRLALKNYKDSLQCEILRSEITCLYPENDPLSKELTEHFVRKFDVKFISYSAQKLKANYTFKLKLLQIEQLDGEELKLGLEQLNTSLGEILRVPLNKIVEKNAVILAQKKVKINTLAEPMGLIRPLSPAEFSIGASIPYNTTSNEGVQNTSWHFAGLKVNLELENVDDKIKINYQTELTKPDLSSSQSSISGNKEKSSVTIPLNEPTQLFQIVLKTEMKGTDQMPFLNRIPLLGEIFKSKSSQSNYKMITGILEIRRHE